MGMDSSVMLLSRLGVGAVATLFAIILWSKTRDTAWMFVVLSVLVSYGEVVYTALKSFGVIHPVLLTAGGVPIFEIILVNLPTLFIMIGCVVMIARRSLR
jgi:hypothetical protein